MPTTDSTAHRLPLVVLLSGSGTNLQAIMDAAREGLPVEIRAVVSNKADAFGLERARRAGIPAIFVDPKNYPDRAGYDAALQRTIDGFEPKLVVLAGFMRILSSDFVRHYECRMLNIHPSLLPKFRGLDTHARCLAAGEREHGATVHFVSPELDAGPIVIQARVPVHANDTPETLAARVLREEHRIYPLAIGWFAQDRLVLRQGKCLLDGVAVGSAGVGVEDPALP